MKRSSLNNVIHRRRRRHRHNGLPRRRRQEGLLSHEEDVQLDWEWDINRELMSETSEEVWGADAERFFPNWFLEAEA